MNVKTTVVLILCSVTLIGIANVPGAPLPLRMGIYTLTSIPSILAGCVTYYYYDSVPESHQSLLTSAAKSVVAWHTIFGASSYTYLIYDSIFWTQVKEDWDENGNETCNWIPTLVSLNVANAALEFQLLRAWLVFDQYYVLGLDHHDFVYPLGFSVPVLSVIEFLLTFWYNGTVCEKQLIILFLYKLNLSKIKIDNLNLPNLNPRIFLKVLIVASQVFILLCRNWNKCKVVKLFSKVSQNSNKVAPNTTTLFIPSSKPSPRNLEAGCSTTMNNKVDLVENHHSIITLECPKLLHNQTKCTEDHFMTPDSCSLQSLSSLTIPGLPSSQTSESCSYDNIFLIHTPPNYTLSCQPSHEIYLPNSLVKLGENKNTNSYNSEINILPKFQSNKTTSTNKNFTSIPKIKKEIEKTIPLKLNQPVINPAIKSVDTFQLKQLGPLLVLVTIILLLDLFAYLTYEHGIMPILLFVCSNVFDHFCLSFSVYWVVSSQEINTFLLRKIKQFKIRLGYF